MDTYLFQGYVNANSFIQDKKSSYRIHFLGRDPLHHESLLINVYMHAYVIIQTDIRIYLNAIIFKHARLEY